MTDRTKLGKEIVEIVEWQFKGVTYLSLPAYNDSLSIIRDQILSIIDQDEEQANKEVK